MALQAFPLNRAQDAAGASLIEITPVNRHRFPSPVSSLLATANATNEGKPRYTGAGATADWVGGVKGDDVDQATATVSIANDGGGANAADYAPRTQAAKATATGNTIVSDMSRARGPYPPWQPWLPNNPILAAPTVTSISPNTAAAGSSPIYVTITGQNFTGWSKVITGGTGSPWDAKAEYISITKMGVLIDPRGAVPGAISIAVEDHDVLSNTNVVFTFT